MRATVRKGKKKGKKHTHGLACVRNTPVREQKAAFGAAFLLEITMEGNSWRMFRTKLRHMAHLRPFGGLDSP